MSANLAKKAFTNEAWSKMADDYERTIEGFITLWAEDSLRVAHERMLAAVASTAAHRTSARNASGDTVSTPLFVDVGCGTGALCIAFAEKYFAPSPGSAAGSSLRDVQVIATDIAEGMLACVDDKLDTRLRFQQYRSQIKTVQMDGQLLDKLNDSSADIIGSNFGLSIFPDRVKAWSSAARVLRDGGVLFATVWDAQSPNLQWADASAAISREVEQAKAVVAAATCEGTGAPSTDTPPPPPFIPSQRAGHGNIENELKAAGFRDVEMHCARHSIEASSSFVMSLLSNPVFIERIGRENHAEFLKRVAANGDITTAAAVAAASGEQVSASPAMVEFVGHILVATK